MRTLPAILIVPAAVLAALACADGETKPPPRAPKPEWTRLRPVPPADSVRLLRRGKPYTCTRIPSSGTLTLEVTGPAELKVVARSEIGLPASGSTLFALAIGIDGRPLKTCWAEAKRSSTVAFPKAVGVVPTDAATFHVDLAAGRHRVTLAGPPGSAALLVRVYRRPTP